MRWRYGGSGRKGDGLLAVLHGTTNVYGEVDCAGKDVIRRKDICRAEKGIFLNQACFSNRPFELIDP